MGSEIKELYNALQRFIERRQKMCVPVEKDDDDIIIANAFDELEQLREENRRLNSRVFVILEDNKQLRDVAKILLRRLVGARQEGLGGIDTHRSARFAKHEIKYIEQALEGRRGVDDNG